MSLRFKNRDEFVESVLYFTKGSHLNNNNRKPSEIWKSSRQGEVQKTPFSDGEQINIFQKLEKLPGNEGQACDFTFICLVGVFNYVKNMFNKSVSFKNKICCRRFG